MFETLKDLKEKYKAYRRRYDPDNTLDEQIHDAYNAWLADQSSRPDAKFTPFEFDLQNNPAQSIYVPKIEARDPYSKLPDALYYLGARTKAARLLGAFTCNRLLDQLENQPVSPDDQGLLIERLKNNRQEGKNTMIVTSHFTFEELGYVKLLRFIAERDRTSIGKDGVVLNKLMSRQSYMGEKLVDQFWPMSNVYFSYPLSANAKKYNVPAKATQLGNALFMQALRNDLEVGGLELDVALTGRQIIKNGDKYEMPEIAQSSAALAKKFDDIVGIAMIKSPVTESWEMEIGQVYDIQKTLKEKPVEAIVDDVYGGIVKSVEKFTGKEVIYKTLMSKMDGPTGSSFTNVN